MSPKAGEEIALTQVETRILMVIAEDNSTIKEEGIKVILRQLIFKLGDRTHYEKTSIG